MLAGEGGAFLVANRPHVAEIALVTDEHDGHVGARVLAGVLQPRGEVVKRLPPGYVIDYGKERGGLGDGDGDTNYDTNPNPQIFSR